MMGFNAYAAMYASIFGLQFQFEGLTPANMYGSFHIRVLGVHNQATNITLEVGLKNGDALTLSPYRSIFLGAGLTLYFAKFFGIDGVYRYFFASTPNSAGQNISAHRVEGGPFIELRILRLYGTYFWEPASNGTIHGFTVGGRFYL